MVAPVVQRVLRQSGKQRDLVVRDFADTLAVRPAIGWAVQDALDVAGELAINTRS